MTTNYHTAIVNGDSRGNDAAIWNDPLGALDSQLSTQAAQIAALNTSGVGSVYAQINNASGEGDTSWVVDNISGTFLAGATVVYSVSGVVYASTVAANTSASPLTVTAAPGVTIPDNTVISMVPTAAAGKFLENIINIKDPLYGATGDGSTDDTTAIQAALTACSANGGGTVYAPPGTYIIADSVTVESNTTLLGAGQGTIFKRAANKDGTGDMNLIKTAVSATNVVFQDFAIDGNGSNQTHGTGSNANQVGLRFRAGTTDSKAIRVTVYNNLNSGIYMDTCTSCEVSHCYAYDQIGNPAYPPTGAPGDGIAVHYGSDLILSDNVCYDNNNDGIVISECSRLKVTGNVCYGNVVGHGIEIFTNDSAHPIEDSVIANNVCYDNGACGIGLFANAGAQYCYGVIVSDNSCTNNADHGANIEGQRHTITGNSFGLNGDNGLRLNSASDCVISGNNIWYNNTSDTAGQAGILLTNTTQQRNQINGNVIVNGGAGHQKYAISLASTLNTNNVIGINTLVDGGETAPILDSGSNTVIWSKRSMFIDPGHMSRSNANLTTFSNSSLAPYAVSTGTANQTMYFAVPIEAHSNSTRIYLTRIRILMTANATDADATIANWYIRRWNHSTKTATQLATGTGPAAPFASSAAAGVVVDAALDTFLDLSTAINPLWIELQITGEDGAGRLQIQGIYLDYYDFTPMYEKN